MKENKDAILILLILFIIMGLAWEPLRSGKFKSSGSLFPTSNSYSYQTSTGYNSNQSVSERSISNQIKEAEETTQELQDQVARDNAEATQSPYYGKISMSYISSLNNPDPSQEFITIYTNLSQGERVDMTGWKIQSTRSGNWIQIGQASTLPKPFSKTSYQNVILQQSDILYVVKGFSPIGISFRTNECSGYFAETRAFSPRLPTSCPAARDENLPQFSNILDRDDECRNLIERVQTCSDPNNTINFKKLPDTVTQSCKDYLRTKINYDTCVENHFGDIEFPGREWYVYQNIFGPLWRSQRESLTLYDKKGLVVSTYSY